MMPLSVFDVFKIGIGPSSSRTIGPMKAADIFVQRLAVEGLFCGTYRVQRSCLDPSVSPVLDGSYRTSKSTEGDSDEPETGTGSELLNIGGDVNVRAGSSAR